MLKKHKTIIKSISVLILYFLFFPIIAYSLKFLNVDISKYKSITLIFIDILLFVIIFLIYKKDIINYFKNFKITFNEKFEIYFKYWLTGLIISTFISFLIMFFITPDLPSNEEAVRSLLLTMPMYAILSTCIVAPFVEEIVFRKTLYDVFKNKKWLFVILSGIIFGLTHIGFSTEFKDLLDSIPYAILGSTFGLMYYKSKNLMYPMFFHFLHNTLLVISFYLSFIIGGK